MTTTITGHVTHLCPFVPEVDVGDVELNFDCADGFIELHGLLAFLRSFHDQTISHEDVTAAIKAQHPFATVTTRWRTAGFEVVYTA